MARAFTLAPGEYYHLYNRGTDKRRIFMRSADYDRFLALLYMANNTEAVDLKVQGRTLSELDEKVGDKTLVDIGAYCLMPNHFHLIVREREEGGISKLMQKVMTGYTMYFNKRNDRTGSLFQGTFKASHIDNDRYLKYLISYVHLNPVKLIEPKWKETGIVNHLAAEKYIESYRYSSYLDYTGQKRPENKLINSLAFPDYFESEHDFKTEVTEWLTYNTE